MSTDKPPPPSKHPKPILKPTLAKPPPTAVKLQIPKSALKKRTTTTPAPTRTFCTCCCCLTWFLITLLLLSVAVGATCGVLWILYRPQKPKFTIASLKLSNLTLVGNLDADASGRLYTSGNLTISVKNPNSKLTVLYGAVSMSVYSNLSNVLIANSTFQRFESEPGNSTVMRFVFNEWRTVDLEAARGLRSELKGKMIGSRLEMETKMGVNIGKWKSRMIGIRVVCVGLLLKRNGSSSESDEGMCAVRITNRIWGFTF